MSFILWSFRVHMHRVLKISKNKHCIGLLPIQHLELAIFLWLQENTQAIYFDTNLEYFFEFWLCKKCEKVLNTV